MKFLCDAMLGRLGRKLRAAGYDARIDDGRRTDHELVELAHAEGRLFLSCDRQIHEIKNSRGVLVYLSSNRTEAWAKYLSATWKVDWTHSPFSRCLDCNEPLEKATDDRKEGLPPNLACHAISHCPACRKLYWEGSHVRRMREELERLNG